MRFRELISRLDPIDVPVNESIFGNFPFATVRITIRLVELKQLSMITVTELKPFVIEASAISLLCNGEAVVNSIGIGDFVVPPVMAGNLIIIISNPQIECNFIKGDITRLKIKSAEIKSEIMLPNIEINKEVNKMLNEQSFNYQLIEKINSAINRKISKLRK